MSFLYICISLIVSFPIEGTGAIATAARRSKSSASRPVSAHVHSDRPTRAAAPPAQTSSSAQRNITKSTKSGSKKGTSRSLFPFSEIDPDDGDDDFKVCACVNTFNVFVCVRFSSIKSSCVRACRCPWPRRNPKPVPSPVVKEAVVSLVKLSCAFYNCFISELINEFECRHHSLMQRQKNNQR